MAKNKNSKRGNLKKSNKGKAKGSKKSIKSNKSFSSAAAAPAPLDNPFELRVNKRKHDNLGRRGRNEQGVPGVSRGRAIEKRKATLLREYKVRNKTNVLQDNRIGEKRKGMPEEEKIVRRSAAEKARQFKQKSIFNLQDGDDMLTHRGQPLMDIDRYEDPRDASDSEDERLDADFVSDANFGGFMKMKKPSEQEPEEYELNDDGQPKSHKEIIHELIMESKKKRFEKAKEADENYELVCKLDDDFKNPDIRNLLLMGGGGKDKKTGESNPPTLAEKEDYDKIVKELQFEAKTGRATDRLKTEEELVQEEKEKLEQLERERLKRMQMSDTDGTRPHRSADDLDDGYFLEDFSKDTKSGENEEVEDEEDLEKEEEDNDEEEEDDSDSYSDMGSESEEHEDEEEGTKTKSNSKTREDGDLKSEEVNDTKKEKFVDIPFVIGIPVKYKEFEVMLKKYKAHYKFKGSSSSEAFNIILTRMVKYNKASDRTRLPKLFNFVLRYVLDMAEKTKKFSEPLLKVFNIALPHLHTLVLLNPNECVNEVEDGELFDDFYPLVGLPVHKILYFSICTKLFSVTDFHHKVLSVMKVRLLQVLSQTKVNNVNTLAKMLFVINIVFKLSEEAKRYAPEVITALNSILQCFAGNEKRWAGFAIPTIRLAKPFLYIYPEECSETSLVNEELWKFISDDDGDLTKKPDLSDKLGIMYSSLVLTKKFVSAYERLPSAIEIFHRIKKTLQDLKKGEMNWPQSIADKLTETIDAISNLKLKREVLIIQVSNRPKPLKLYEPMIEEDFDGIRKKKAPKGKQETARLSHKVKQEMKNAVREIRKDTSFLAKQQLREQLDKDAERKRKVKEIMGSLANQEGEYQKSKRLKKT